MHHSRLRAMLIDCNTPDIDQAAGFWAGASGRAIDPDHPGTRGNYRMLETPADEAIVQIQRVGHQSRVHLDIETDDIPAEVARLEELGASASTARSGGWSCRRPSDRGSAWSASNAPAFRRTRTGGRSTVARVEHSPVGAAQATKETRIPFAAYAAPTGEHAHPPPPVFGRHP